MNAENQYRRLCLPALDEIGRDHTLADIVAIIGAIGITDIVFGEIDR